MQLIMSQGAIAFVRDRNKQSAQRIMKNFATELEVAPTINTLCRAQLYHCCNDRTYRPPRAQQSGPGPVEFWRHPVSAWV